MATLCLTIIPMLGVKFALLIMFPFIVLIFVNPKLHNEFITINETGILCQKSGKQLWAYEWDRIAELKRSSRFLLPSIEVIALNKYGISEHRVLDDSNYFQLGRPAREAIKRYYKPTEHSLNQ